MNVSTDKADATIFACIDPLPQDIKQNDIQTWVDQVNTLAYSYQRISNFSTEVFWSTILYNANFLFSFDSALENIPKGHSLERFNLVHRWNESAKKAVDALRFQILIIYCRIHDNKMSKNDWLEFTQDRDIMPLTRAAHVWSLFPQKSELFAKIMSINSKALSNPQRAIRDLTSEYKSAFEHYESAVGSLLEKFSHMRGAAQIKAAGLIRKFFYLVADNIFSALVALDVLHLAELIKDTSFIVKVPHLVETLGQTFPVGVLMDVAAILPGWPMRNLLQINSQIEQGAVKLFKKGIEITSNDKDKFQLVEGILNCERFLFLDKEFFGFTSQLSSFSDAERGKIEEAVITAVNNQEHKVVERVEEQGLLQSLGEVDRLQPEQRRALDELKDVFQHMSLPYLHLCLRHFNYNATYAIESMLSADHRMPLDLRRMEHYARPSRNGFEPSLPTISYRDIDMLNGAIKPSRSAPPLLETREEDKKNVFKGLFSLAPASVSKPTSTNSSSESAGPSRSVLPEIIESLCGSVERSKIRASGKTRQKEVNVQQGIQGEKLIPMHESKRYGVSKFKTTVEDKKAVLGTYEQYKFETQFEEDNLYDDEYDDGYEQREFQVEPLNERLSEEESEEEEKPDEAPKAVGQQRGGGQVRGSRGGNRGQRGGGGRGGKLQNNQETRTDDQDGSNHGGSSHTTYTGGRQRQMKERHKNEWKQRGADRKRRGAFF